MHLLWIGVGEISQLLSAFENDYYKNGPEMTITHIVGSGVYSPVLPSAVYGLCGISKVWRRQDQQRIDSAEEENRRREEKRREEKR